MKYILDTDIVSNLIKKKSPHREILIRKLREHSLRDVYVSVFTQCELYFGLNRIDKQQYNSQLSLLIDNFLSSMNILDLPVRFSETYGQVRAFLVNRGEDIGIMDCMIASQVIAYGYTLVTHNVKHYARILELKTVDFKMVDWID